MSEETLEQRIVLYTQGGTKKVYDSAYTQEQIREVLSNCKLNHKGSVPTSVLASKFGGRLTA